MKSRSSPKTNGPSAVRELATPNPTGLSRRRWLGGCACITTGLFTGLMSGSAHAGLFNPCEARTKLPADLADAVAASFEGLDHAQVWDVHAHLLGNGDSGSGCTLHPSLVRGWKLTERVRHAMILNAACVDRDAPSVDRAYVERLAGLGADFPAGFKWCLFAFDRAHDDDGRALDERTTFHVPNDYTAAVARGTHASRFEWVASIHPYRADAVQAIRVASEQGAVALKWLPSAMNIDLRSPRMKAVYDELARLRLPVVVHVGEEKAVPGAGRDDLGNPLLLRVPLAHGVRVIAAHAASLGTALDLDQRAPGKLPAFSLFARLMDETAHEGRLMGDVSAVWQTNRTSEVWHEVLKRTDWHARLLHGSDYPLPGLMPLHRSSAWVKAEVLKPQEAERVDALRKLNPLLADWYLKRSLRHRGAALSRSVFETRSKLISVAPKEPRA